MQARINESMYERTYVTIPYSPSMDEWLPIWVDGCVRMYVPIGKWPRIYGSDNDNGHTESEAKKKAWRVVVNTLTTHV